MGQRFMLGLCTLLSGAIAATGCSQWSCGANPQRLSLLKQGMTYSEVSQTMGCAGRLVRGSMPSTEGYATVEWDGPDSLLFSRTYVMFLDGRLHSVATDGRGGS
jgi:hypothetical protein